MSKSSNSKTYLFDKQDDFIFHEKWLLYAPAELKKLIDKEIDIDESNESIYQTIYFLNRQEGQRASGPALWLQHRNLPSYASVEMERGPKGPETDRQGDYVRAGGSRVPGVVDASGDDFDGKSGVSFAGALQKGTGSV
ncbi:MAG: hypothetical protein LIO92_00785 [Clostridiales bacterium]|nr:hypothetical protein [Clostridiales bacterium]